MSRILFINNMSLANPRRGTPIRLHNILREIKKNHELVVCTNNVSEEFLELFISFPQMGIFSRLLFFMKVIKSRKIDVILTGTEINIKLPIILKMLTGVKIAVDLHGLYAEELYLANKIGLLKKYWLGLETYFFLLFYDRIFTVSEKLKNYYGLLKNREVVLYGGVETADFPYIIPKEPDIFTIGYMGNSRLYQGLGELLEALYILKTKLSLKFSLNLIISEVDENLLRKLSEFDLRNDTKLIENVSQEQAFKSIIESTILVIPRPMIKVTDYAYPSKLPEFLYTGRPVITTNVGPISEFSKADGCFKVISSDHIVEELVGAIKDLEAVGPEVRRVMGENARNFVNDSLTWHKIGQVASKSLDF